MHIDTKLPDLGRVIFRKKLDSASGHTVDGHPVLAGTIIHSETGYAIVLLVEGAEPVMATGLSSEYDAREKFWDLVDRIVPDFLADFDTPYVPPPPKQSRARTKIVVTSERGHTPRHHGRVRYVITAETEGQIMYAARRLMKEHQGYGLWFGELETVDGVLTLRGSRSDNCE